MRKMRIKSFKTPACSTTARIIPISQGRRLIVGAAEKIDADSGQKFFKVRITALHPKRPITFDIYVMINGHYTLYLRAGSSVDPIRQEQFVEKSAEVFYVRDEERFIYKDYIHSHIMDEALPTNERAMILKESSLSLVEELYENPKVDEALEESKIVVGNFIDFIQLEENDAISNLIGLSSHDFYTYNHSLDVSVYSLGLAQKVSFTTREQLMDMGRGAIFHDIGKRLVPVEIITKKGGLTEEEWAQMKKHPLYGIQILNKFPNISDAVKACVFEHHENHIGNGYPQQLKGNEIHPMAGIVALTDTYDALTTKRSYNVPMTPEAAVAFMKEKLAGRFDPELLKAFYSVLFKVK